MTKICVTASGPELDALIDPRFGRCAYFIFIDSDTMQFEAVQNDAVNTFGGAGIKAAQKVASMGAEVVITGSVGPNAYPALENSDIRILTGASGSVKEAVENFNQDSLSEITTPGPGYIGMGGQMGIGRGRGRGRRQGRRGRW